MNSRQFQQHVQNLCKPKPDKQQKGEQIWERYPIVSHGAVDSCELQRKGETVIAKSVALGKLTTFQQKATQQECMRSTNRIKKQNKTKNHKVGGQGREG